MNNLAIVNKLRFPKRFDHLSGESLVGLKTKIVSADGGHLAEVVYDNLNAAAAAMDLSTLAGPFGDSINGALCIRFETNEACRILST